MSIQSGELEAVLRSLINEHQRLIMSVDAQRAAMKAMDLKAMDLARQQQEAARLRIATLETRRRGLVMQIVRPLGLTGEPTLTRLAELFPQRSDELMRLRDELRDVVNEVSQHTTIAARLAGAVLGHLNTAVRLLAGAVEDSGMYTKHGVAAVNRRIGVIEAVG
jgi:hypothetical protein